mgnify:FL=1
MLRKIWRACIAFMTAAILAAPQVALAHESVTAGDYTLEYGWLNEPVIVGQPNALILFFSGGEEHAEGSKTGESDSHEAAGLEVDVSGLTVEVRYGGETKSLALQPLGEDTPGQFVAPIIPTRLGQYTLKVNGKVTGSLGEADVNLEVEPEEVEGAESVQFPSVAAQSSSDFGLTGWLAAGGLVSGLLGLGVAVVALTRKR